MDTRRYELRADRPKRSSVKQSKPVVKRAAAAGLEEHPDWIELRTLLMKALDPFPDAQQAVADRLSEHLRKLKEKP